MDPAAEAPVTPTPGGDSVAGADARQRSSSPWAFKISGKVAGRVHSTDGASGMSTPVRAGYGRFPSSGAPAVRQVAGRASYESALLTAVRKQIDTFEEKVGTQISKMQSQENKLREAALTRLEEKMHATEGAQPKLDRKIAELTGNFKGLSDEMQSQIRRVDSVDERLWEWRHSMEEDFRQRVSELEQHVQKVQSSTRVMYVSLEDMQKKQNLRLQRIELDAGDRLAVHEETREALLTLHGRLEVLEERTAGQGQDELPVFSNADLPRERSETSEEVANNSALLGVFERRMGDVSEKLERVAQDSIDMHQSSKQHEVQLSSLRTHLDAREEQVRRLTERLESSDLEGRLEQLRRTIDEDRSDKVGVLEKMELLGHRIEDQEQSYEGLRSRHDHLLHTSLHLQPLDLTPGGSAGLDRNVALELDMGGGGQGGGSSGAAVEECLARLASAESRLAGLTDSVRETVDFGPRVGALVAQLTEIVPKVIEQEGRIGDIRGELSGLMPRGELEPLLDVMRKQGQHSVQAAADLAEVRRELGTELKAEMQTLRGEVQASQASIRNDMKGKESTDAGLLSASAEILDNVVTKQQLATATSLLKTSLQELCRDEDASLRRQLEDSIASSSSEARRLVAAEVSKIQSAFSPNSASPSKEDAAWRRELSNGLSEVKEEYRLLGETTSILKRLRDDVTNLQRLHERAEAEGKAMTRPQVEQFCKSMREDLRRELSAVRPPVSAEVMELRRSIESLRNESHAQPERPHTPRENSTHSDGGSPRASPRLEFVKALQQDEEIEREKQQKLLDRIDELCGHIAAVDSAVAMSGQNGSLQMDGMHEFSALAARVDQQSRKNDELHSQLAGKFDQVIRQVEALSRQGR